ncbi:uncharacterized protein LOC112127946 isoform X1 [Cimex lectularius]|uniref:Uncharacterized protein n=1 Tax=Cimex lectularius TaxID=79782 RepID=A0A8I6SPA9_CIMLE|nr:uncharacterized protein LOC112127946 isoform X1 [Cimex lectularius]
MPLFVVYGPFGLGGFLFGHCTEGPFSSVSFFDHNQKQFGTIKPRMWPASRASAPLLAVSGSPAQLPTRCRSARLAQSRFVAEIRERRKTRAFSLDVGVALQVSPLNKIEIKKQKKKDFAAFLKSETMLRCKIMKGVTREKIVAGSLSFEGR